MMRPLHQPAKSFSDLARYLGATTRNASDILLTGAHHSSKEIEAGDLFIAIPGATQHGAHFIAAAAERGAVAILTDSDGAELAQDLPVIIVSDVRAAAGIASAWIYGEPMRSLSPIGVTGTNGKTTTTYLIYQLFMRAGHESGLIGTIETRIGNEAISSARTTPEGADLQSLAAVMKERHLRHLVMEVSSHSIALNRVKGSYFSALGFTNLTQDHLDFHPSMESYFQAKASLFTQEYGDVAFINIDDPYGRNLADHTELPVIRLSRNSSQADWYYTEIHRGAQETHFAIRGRYGILIESSTSLLGDFNLDNLLMAIAMVEYSGIDPVEIAALVPTLKAAPGRLERVDVGQPFTALVDYAHTPDAVTHVLSAVRAMTSGRVIAVLGCGGDRDATKRPLMGDALIQGADIAIFTSDNPRSEHPATILADMTQGLDIRSPHSVIEDRSAAIHHAVQVAEPGDCVIVLGKGHERGQEIHGVVTAFDDRLVLAHAIEAKP